MREKHPNLSVCGPAPSIEFALNFTNPDFGRFSGSGRSRVHPYGKCEKLSKMSKTDRFFGDLREYRNRQKVKKSRVRFFVAGEIFARPVPTGPARNGRKCEFRVVEFANRVASRRLFAENLGFWWKALLFSWKSLIFYENHCFLVKILVFLVKIMGFHWKVVIQL